MRYRLIINAIEVEKTNYLLMMLFIVWMVDDAHNPANGLIISVSNSPNGITGG